MKRIKITKRITALRKIRRRTALAGIVVLVIFSAACVQLAPMARLRMGPSETNPSIPGGAGIPVRVVTDPGTVSTSGLLGGGLTGRGTALVQRGPITDMLSIDGRVTGAEEVNLSFSSSGRVQTIAVTPGQRVERGQILAEADAKDVVKDLTAARSRLETSLVRLSQAEATAAGRRQEAGQRAQLDSISNQKNVLDAEGTLRRTQENLDQVRAGPTATERTTAEAAVTSAQTAADRADDELRRLTAGASPADIQTAEQDLAAARVAVQRADADLGRLRAGADPAEVRTAERDALAAQADFDRAQMELGRLSSGPDTQAIRAAEREVDGAQASLKDAQNSKSGARDSDIRRAQANLDQAQERLAAARQGPRPGDVELARNKAQSARLALDDARERLDRVRRGPDSATIEAAKVAADRAHTGLQTVDDHLSALRAGPTAQQVTATSAAVDTARASLAGATAKLAELNARPTSSEIRDAEERVTIAQSALTRARLEGNAASNGADSSTGDLVLQQKGVEDDRAQVAALERQLEASRIRAPLAGVVTTLQAAPGDPISVGLPVVTLAASEQAVVVASISDREAARLAPGQTALIKLEGGDDFQPTGAVVRVDDAPNGAGKRVLVRVDWGEIAPPFGSQARMNVTLDFKESVLLIPEKAVRTNGARRYVEYMEGTSRRTADVEIGVVSGGFAEVIRGLSEGQTVQVRS